VGPIPHPTLVACVPHPAAPLSPLPFPSGLAGNTLVSNPLTAIGTFLVNTLQQQLKEARKAGGEDLSKQLGQSMAGRRLLQVRAEGLGPQCGLMARIWCILGFTAWLNIQCSREAAPALLHNPPPPPGRGGRMSRKVALLS